MWATLGIGPFRETRWQLGSQFVLMVCVWCGVTLCGGSPAGAQSAADLQDRLLVDGLLDDWQAAECVFRNTAVCSALALPGPCPPEEPLDDSAWSRLQELQQIKVTWDATHLYIAVEAVIADHALVVLLDTDRGGLGGMTELAVWRRAIRFGNAFNPDYLLAVHDRQRSPELWRVRSPQGLESISPDEFTATASFQVDAAGRALEAAIPWSVLFPGAPFLVNPDSLAPEEPMFVLPTAAAVQGLRLLAVLVHAEDGLSAADVAPDASHPLPLASRDPVTLDRAVHVEWSSGTTAPHFVAFGQAVQLQAAARFVPETTLDVTPHWELSRLDTYAVQALGTSETTRLLLADAGYDLQFVFDFNDPALNQVYVTASIFSMRGERVLLLYQNSLRQSVGAMAPWGRFSNPLQDRWGGEDRHGKPMDAGMYFLRITAGANPGVVSTREQRTIVVVR
jgi:hypothetical protein